MYCTSRVKKKNMLLAMLTTILYSVNPQGRSINIKTHYTAHGICGLKYFVSNAFLCSTYITRWHKFQSMKNNESTLMQNWMKPMSLSIITGQFSTPNGIILLQTAHFHSMLIKTVINKENANSKNSKITCHKSTQNNTVAIC
jgi:hypothetical protein